MEVRQWSVMCHGLYNTRYHWDYSEDEERAAIAECVDLYGQMTGRHLRGWFSPAASYTMHTPDLIAEAGITYYADWHHDDLPLRVRAGNLITLPYTMDLNDSNLHRQQFEAADYAEMTRDAFDTLYAEGGQVMCLALHPYMMGQPHRIAHLAGLLEYIQGHGDVWMATGDEIADWYMAQCGDHIAWPRAREATWMKIKAGRSDIALAPRARGDMTIPRKGMDHGQYPFSALPTRAPLHWPGRARLAMTVLLHLEYWELEAPQGAVRDTRFTGEYGSYFPEYRPFTQREYGNRIGIFRVLDLLDGFNFKVTVAANAMALSRYPDLVQRLVARGCEFAAHGEAQTRMMSSAMTEAEERAVIERTTNAFLRHLGARPRGWLGPDSGESPRTPQLLAEAGYTYLLDWPNDDQPYAMTTTPPIISMPNQMEWDDETALWLRRVPNARYPAPVSVAAEALAAEGGRSVVRSVAAPLGDRPSAPDQASEGGAGASGASRRGLARNGGRDRGALQCSEPTAMSRTLQDIAPIIRSKNAGPTLLTIDMMFGDATGFQTGLAALTPGAVAHRFGRDAGEITVIPYPPAHAVKIVMGRACTAGLPGDRDVNGAQQHGPLLGLPV